MIIRTISDRANLLDSFVILYASFVAALYKLKGADLGKQLRCVFQKLASFPED